jgi:hypothetical protein
VFLQGLEERVRDKYGVWGCGVVRYSSTSDIFQSLSFIRSGFFCRGGDGREHGWRPLCKVAVHGGRESKHVAEHRAPAVLLETIYIVKGISLLCPDGS